MDAQSLPWTLGLSSDACQAATRLNGGWNSEIQQANSGDIALANMAGVLGEVSRVSGNLKTPEGQTETYNLGKIKTNETQIGFQVLSERSAEICLSGVRM